ncbi:MAG TPA: HD domain-containing phosphohydrolase [Candidatus Cryosericum sp.]|nr:HD domain-containing phosphohydrolase [Candidatus Cryosericum sp.]
MRPRGRIVYTFLLVMLAVGLLPLAMVAQKLITISRESLVTSQQEVQLQLASAIARQIDGALDGRKQEMSRLAEGMAVMPKAAEMGPAPPVWQHLLDRYLGGGFVMVRYTRPSGPPVEARHPGLVVPKEAEEAIARGIQASAQGASTVSEPVVLGEGRARRALLAITVPVRGGASGGVLCGLVDVEALWAPAIGAERGGYTIYAVDREARLFAAQDESGILDRGDYRSFGVVQEFGRSAGRSALTTEFTMVRDGQPVEYLASVDSTSMGWGIFVQLQKGQAYAAVNQMVRAALIWAGLAVGLALVLAYLLAATVTRPIHALASGTEAFAKGQLEHRVQVRSRNELGALAATFNGMAQQMQEYIQRLKVAAQINNELFMGTIRALAEAIDEKDPYTRGHSERVNGYAVLLGKQIGLGRKEMREVHISSLFHDIGKIGIEDKILRKPAMLTDQEYAVMKQHPEKGAQMLSKIKAMKDIIPGIRFHHERWDGSGYPLGMKGEQIPIAARIVAVADAFDAMTTNRPYQKAMPFDKAIGRLLELSDRAYDRKVVTALAEAFRAGSLKDRQPVEVEEQ